MVSGYLVLYLLTSSSVFTFYLISIHLLKIYSNIFTVNLWQSKLPHHLWLSLSHDTQSFKRWSCLHLVNASCSALVLCQPNSVVSLIIFHFFFFKLLLEATDWKITKSVHQFEALSKTTELLKHHLRWIGSHLFWWTCIWQLCRNCVSVDFTQVTAIILYRFSIKFHLTHKDVW